MKCDIGHFEIKAEGRCYNLVPSFENIMKLGDAKELVAIYNDMHSMSGQPQFNETMRDTYMYLVDLSAKIIRACSDIDPSRILMDVTERGDKFKFKISVGHKIGADRQIIIAAGLIRHGVAGVDKDKKKAKGKPATEIDLWEFVNTARAHLDMSRTEALSLTMTEFVKMMAIKFPPEKNGADSISDEEYESSMAMLAAANKIRDAK